MLNSEVAITSQALRIYGYDKPPMKLDQRTNEKIRDELVAYLSAIQTIFDRSGKTKAP